MFWSGLKTLALIFVGVQAILVLVESEGLSEIRERDSNGISELVSYKDGEEKEKAAPNCKKLMLVVAKRMLKVFNGCIKALKEQYPTKEAASEHFQCAIKCFMLKVKMVNSDGKMTNSSLAAFAEEQLPPEYHPLYWKLMGSCFTEWGDKLDPKDEKCTSYGEIIKCLQDTATSSCV